MQIFNAEKREYNFDVQYWGIGSFRVSEVCKKMNSALANVWRGKLETIGLTN